MKIALIDIEPKIFNTAYMQISAYHKKRGDTVEWWTALEHNQFDLVYCSSIFDFTDKSQIPKDVICGGTGFDIKSSLPGLIESCEYDYSIYPKCLTSYVWFSRGCIRKCPWCVVPEKEGTIRPCHPKRLNSKGLYITVMDNNFFANPQWRRARDFICSAGQKVLIEQGIDVRIFTKEQAEFINQFHILQKKGKNLRIAWDDPRQKLENKIKQAVKWIGTGRITCYVLIGYSSTAEEDYYRVDTIRGMGAEPFVMPYDRSDLYQRAFARWANDKAIFNKVTWQDYKYRVEKQETAGRGWF